jgi:cation diffusion facilitator family transporter
MADSSRKVIYAALIGNALIAVTKFIAAVTTGSSAMMSEGIHSVVDTGNQILLLHGLRRSRKPPDNRFPFGYGKEVYFWSFVVAILIFALGAGISVYEGMIHIVSPEHVSNVSINFIVLGLAMVFEGFAWYFAFREFTKAKGGRSYIEAVKRGKDPSMFVVLFEDTAALLGLAVAFVSLLLVHYTEILIFDGIGSVIIGLILGATAIWLAYETKGLLIGESAESSVVQGIRKIAASFKEIGHVNEVLTMHMGPDFILVNISVDFVDAASSQTIEATISRMDREIKGKFPNVKRVFIEAEARSSGISSSS